MTTRDRTRRDSTGLAPRVDQLEARPLLALGTFLPSFSLQVPATVEPGGITTGPDGALWFTESEAGRIGRITTAGAFSEFPVPSGAGLTLGKIVAGPDGALWFTEQRTHVGSINQFTMSGSIGRITTAGVVSEFPLPADTVPLSIAAGPDGNLWVSEEFNPLDDFLASAGRIGKLTPTGTLVEYPLAAPVQPPAFAVLPGDITPGPDGALWFVQSDGESHVGLGRIATDGTLSEIADRHAIVPVGLSPSALTTGPDGNLWLTWGGGIDRVTTAGVITSFVLPDLAGGHPPGMQTQPIVLAPSDITSGPDGALWFTEMAPGPKVGRITTAGVVTEFPVPDRLLAGPPSFTGFPAAITAGPDGALWYAGSDFAVYGSQLIAPTLAIGRITTAGAVTETPVPPALLPVVGDLDPTSRANAPRQTFDGLAPPGSTVRLFAARTDAPGTVVPLGQVRAGRFGIWRLKARPLADGSYQILAAVSGRGVVPSGPIPLYPGSHVSPVVIDTVAPRVVAASFDATTRIVALTLQDVGTGFDGSGLPSIYQTRVTKPGSRGSLGLSLNPFLPPDGSVPGPEEPLLFAGVIQDPHPEPGDRYTIRIIAADITDAAGNPLDGEFRGRFPSGDGRPGGDFVIQVGGA
jgi:virginiamycin B lyase